jgi:hypothetical protein
MDELTRTIVFLGYLAVACAVGGLVRVLVWALRRRRKGAMDRCYCCQAEFPRAAGRAWELGARTMRLCPDCHQAVALAMKGLVVTEIKCTLHRTILYTNPNMEPRP